SGMYRRLTSTVLQVLHRRPQLAAGLQEEAAAAAAMMGRASTSAAVRWHSTTPVAGARSGTQERFEQLIEDEARRRKPSAMGTASGRKRRSVTASIPQPREPQVISIAIAESLSLYDIQSDAQVRNLYTATFIDDESDHAIHLVKRPEYAIDKAVVSEAFVFSDGVVVFWNVDPTTRAQLLRDLERHAEGAYESVTAHSEVDSIGFTIADHESRSDSRMDGDKFVLDGRLHADLRHRSHASVLERFAFSHAFAASVKLGVWEALLNSLAEPLAETTRKLKEGVIPWKRSEALRKCGDFAELRHSINLNCMLLNRDIYWDRSHLEEFYIQTSRYLTIQRRMQLLNSRLDYCEEIVRMVDGMLAVRHSNTLEWMIIVLIVIEVAFAMFHFVESFEPQRVVIVQPELLHVQQGEEAAAAASSKH
ncbi:hypothetical protein PFISCL1PPCAC_8657, partial [Pristionchus fissidentatus]